MKHSMFGRMALLAALLATSSAPASAQRALTTDEWRSDLRVLADSLPRKHRAPFARVSREAFDSAVADLHEKIPSMQDHEVIVGMARIVAMLHDGHTRLTLPQDPAIAYDRAHTPTPPPADSSLFMNHLPVRLDIFEEGVFIRAAATEYRDLIGLRVLEIGTVPVDSALERMRPVVHYDNEMAFRFMAPAYLVVPEVLHAQRISPTPERVRILAEDSEGRRREVALEAVPLFRAPDLIEARELGPKPIPLWERRRGEKYWMEVLPAERTLYIQFNEVYNREDESLRAFTTRVERVIADSAVRRIILDLRHNPGGNAALARPLLLALVRSDANRLGQLYTLIGRETFSAAQMLVNEMESLTNTLFVGEPTGSSPSMYGDSRKFQLPNSNLTVRASTIYWRDRSGDETRQWTPPHLPVPLKAAEYFRNRDPVLETALAFNPGSLGDLAAEVAFQGGEERAINVLARLLRDPYYGAVDLESEMFATGHRLLSAGQKEKAVLWTRMIVGMYPNSAAAHLIRARALQESGGWDEALQAVTTALNLDPESAEAQQLHRTLRGGTQ